jgi:hypothetical protein
MGLGAAGARDAPFRGTELPPRLRPKSLCSLSSGSEWRVTGSRELRLL